MTVVKEIFKQLPGERIVYFGDTARMPYGPRPHREVRKFALQIIEFLETQDIKMVIIACNSASAAGLQHYQEKIKVPVTGVIEPGVRAALACSRNRRIGVIGTTGTIKSGAYDRALKKMDPGAKVFSQACPLLVLIVENNLVTARESRRVVEEYLAPLKGAGIDALILGCTHYPLLSGVIQEVMGPGVRLISSAEETAREARRTLQHLNLLSPGEENSGHHRFYVSSSPVLFLEIGEKLMEEKLKAYQVILP